MNFNMSSGIITKFERVTEEGVEYEVRSYRNGTRVWYLNGNYGLCHREHGPALECANGNRYWYLNGQLHREDGPALECANGNRYWYLNGQLRREDGPALECLNGDRYWYLNDNYHRENGPAIEYSNGDRAWYWNGVYLTEEVLEQGIDQLTPEEIKFWLPILAAQKSE